MSQQQSYFTGLHYNKSNYESNEDNILASDIIETTSKKFLTNSSQTLDGTKTFTNGVDLSSIKCNGVEKINLSNELTIYGTKLNLANDTNKYLEIGTNTANVCYLDFHSSNTSNTADYHSRILSTAGTTVGTGSLSLQASTIQLSTNTTVSSNQLKVGSTTVQGVSLNGNGNSYIDFYGMNNTNSAFDSRIECVGGNATTAGTGELHFWSNGVNIAAHDGTKGLRLGGVLVTPTAYDLNTIAKASSVEYVTGSTHTWNGSRVIMVNTTSGSGCSITMPAVTSVGNRQVTIYNYGGQNVVINRSGTNLFNGNQTSITLSNNNENVTLLEVTTAAFVGFIQTSFNSTVRTLNGV